MDIDRFIAMRGGVFEPDTRADIQALFRAVGWRFGQHQHLVRDHLYTDAPRPLRFELLNDSRFNAVAYATPGQDAGDGDFIGIHAGVVFTLLDVFERMLAQPDTFDDVGNPGLESRRRPKLPHLPTNSLRDGHAPVWPRCPVRAKFAFILAQTALDFLFFHELTHLRHGHVDHLRQATGRVFWQEMAPRGTPPLDPLTSQALEMDADCGAVLHTLNEAWRFKDGLHTAPRGPADERAALQHAYGEGAQALRTVAFATYVLFRLFDCGEWAWWRQDALSHPSPPLRMFLIGPTLHRLLRDHPEYGYAVNDFGADDAATVLAAETACGLICGQPPDDRGIRSVLGQRERCLAYLDLLAGRWALLRPALEVHKRGGPLP